MRKMLIAEYYFRKFNWDVKLNKILSYAKIIYDPINI